MGCWCVLWQSRLPVYLAHTPSGTSTQNMVHYAQVRRIALPASSCSGNLTVVNPLLHTNWPCWHNGCGFQGMLARLDILSKIRKFPTVFSKSYPNKWLHFYFSVVFQLEFLLLSVSRIRALPNKMSCVVHFYPDGRIRAFPDVWLWLSTEKQAALWSAYPTCL